MVPVLGTQRTIGAKVICKTRNRGRNNFRRLYLEESPDLGLARFNSCKHCLKKGKNPRSWSCKELVVLANCNEPFGRIEKMSNRCTWCGSIGTVSKHPDKNKAKEGITRCSACNMCHSPNAPIKGSYAYWDGNRIVTGVNPLILV